jgi:hypothetical protein
MFTQNITSGWMVTYVIDVRGGGPSSGYISSGFFGGKLAGYARGSTCLFVNRSHDWPCRSFVGEQKGKSLSRS